MSSYPHNSFDRNPAPWVPLTTSLVYLLRSPRLLGVSLLLILATAGLTWLAYALSLDLIHHYTGSFFTVPPTVQRFWDWPLLWGWKALKWLFFILVRVVAFYLAFVIAYSLTTPGYVFLSNWAGDRFTDRAGQGEAGLTLAGVLIDLWEGIKIGGLGLVITAMALVANFIPVIGQATVFLLYVFYSALMFVDFPSSRYRWTLEQKLGWVLRHRLACLRLGLFPALVSLVPVLNVFAMALLFPLFTIHATLNFLAIEGREEAVRQT